MDIVKCQYFCEETIRHEKKYQFLRKNSNFVWGPSEKNLKQELHFYILKYKEYCKRENIETEYYPRRLHNGRGRSKAHYGLTNNMILGYLEDMVGSTENVSQALDLMRSTIHSGLKTTSFEVHHVTKPSTELTNIIKDTKIYLFHWTKSNNSVTLLTSDWKYDKNMANIGIGTRHLWLSKGHSSHLCFTLKNLQRVCASWAKSGKGRNSDY